MAYGHRRIDVRAWEKLYWQVLEVSAGGVLLAGDRWPIRWQGLGTPHRVMTIDQFLSTFEQFSDGELCALRRSPVLDQLPNDPRLYQDVAEQMLSPSNAEYQQRYRLVRVLQECLYHDGRSFAALMWLAERSLNDPDEHDVYGTHALAAVSRYLPSGRSTPLSDEQLVRLFTMFMKRSKLAQNAFVCREIILRRRPDLVSAVGTDRGSPNTRRAPVLLYEFVTRLCIH